jgi:hypothetical protein
MKCAAAFGTAGISGSGGNLAIELKQLLMKSGVVQQGLIQRSHPFL